MQRITLDSEISYVVTEKELKEIRADERAKMIDELVDLINTMPTYENEYGEKMPMPIEMIAEQLKEQKNENRQ